MEYFQKYIHSRNFTFRLYFLLTAITGLSVLAWIFNSIPPKQGSVITGGIILITAIIFCFLVSFIKNVRRCFIWSGGIGILLILRAAKLHDPLYVVLLGALLVSLELALKNR